MTLIIIASLIVLAGILFYIAIEQGYLIDKYEQQLFNIKLKKGKK